MVGEERFCGICENDHGRSVSLILVSVVAICA